METNRTTNAFSLRIVALVLGIFTVSMLGALMTPAVAEATYNEPKKGSISVCKAIVDGEGNVVDGTGVTGTFELSGLDFNSPDGVLPTSQFSTPLSFNKDVFSGVDGDDVQCITYNDLTLGSYYYGEEVITGDNWLEPKYNDQHTKAVESLSDFFAYSGELFTPDTSDDEARNKNADGHIVLSKDRPDRTLIVLNEFKKPEIPDAPYCGDGEVNQSWEQCDGGGQCTAQCQTGNQCVELALARVNVDETKNWGTGDVTSDIFLGGAANKIPEGTWFLLAQNGVPVVDTDMTSNGYEDVPGISVERQDGAVRLLLHGSHEDANGTNKEHVNGNLEFWGASILDQSSDDSGNNKLEKGFDGEKTLNAGQDEVWLDGNYPEQSFFWLTVTTADDGFFTTYEDVPECASSLVASKVMCEDETHLPNWSGDDIDITENTAIDFVAQSGGHCTLEPDWEFQYGDQSASNPGDNTGEAAGPWTTFGPTNNDGVASVSIADIDDISRLWVREVFQDGFVPFTHATTKSDVSAEMYCHKDVLNYDNYDFINNPKAGETYYCVAFNAPKKDAPVCDPNVNLLKNGGFETPALSANSWDVFYTGETGLEWSTGDNGVEIQNNVAGSPYAGAQHAELDPHTVTEIWQEVATIPGETYRFETKYSPRPGRTLEDVRFEFLLNGSTLGADVARSGEGNTDTDWTHEERFFVATEASTTVGFVETGLDTSYGAYLDEVGLYCDPNPPVVNQKPVITIGDAVLTLTVGDTFTEDVTANDPEDGVIPFGNIVITGSVDTNIVGSYDLEYDVVDSQGLAADTVTRTVHVVAQPAPKGSITVCKAIVDEYGNVVDGAEASGSFVIDGLDGNNAAGILPTSNFSTALSFTDDVFASVNGNDIECVRHNNLDLGQYYYDQETVNGDGWGVPLYNDQFDTPVTDTTDFFPYDDALFTNDTADDAGRNQNADGHIVLTEQRPDRTLIVLNEYTLKPAPYCGDGVQNQAWEMCDGTDGLQTGEQCTAQCQIANQCVEKAFARVNVELFENHSNGDITDDIFLGSALNKIPMGAWFLLYDSGTYVSDANANGYEDVQGLAVERQEGSVRVVAHGSHPNDGSKEHIVGDVEFFNFEVTEPTSDDSGNNKLENGFDMIMDNVPGQDEVWLKNGNDTQSFFWLTVTTADDGFFANYGDDVPMCVQPNTPPTITLEGDNPQIIPLFGTYTNLGAVATDAEDDDTVLTGQIVHDSSSVDTNVVGTYEVTYDVTDSGGLAAETATRTVSVVDDSDPAACSDRDDNDGDQLVDALDPGCWSDPNDPNTYDPNDDDENQKPVITRIGDNVRIPLGTPYNDEGATAEDAEDGVITDDIVTTGTSTIDVNTTGVYTVRYNVTDSDGAAADEVTRTVEVYDPTPPVCVSNCGGGGGGGGGPIPDNLTIFNETITVIGEGTALITWETNKPADSRVVYDDESQVLAASTLNFGVGSENLGYDFTTDTNPTLTKEHSVIVTDVNLEDLFYFRPLSSDGTRAIGIELSAVLGEVTGGTCEQYLFEFIRFGENNNPVEVRKLQTFLNDFEEAGLEVNGIYDLATFNAVVAFQNKYAGDVLSPWGLEGDTGYVYLTTRKKINEIYCNFQLPFPLTGEQQAEVDAFRALLESLEATGQPLPDTSNVGFAPSAPTFAGDDETPSVTLVEETPEGGDVLAEEEEGTDSLAAAADALAGEDGGVFSRIGDFFKNLFR